jgi:prolipoprotein diacylglyceryltransferase
MTDAPLFTLAGLPVTAYALGLALSLALSSALAARGLRVKGYAPRVVETFLLIALPLGLLLSRLAYVLIRLNFFLDWGEGLALRFWQGGYSMWGALAGFLLSADWAARMNHVAIAPLADALAPYGLLTLALGRGCEGLAGQGFGQLAPESLAFFPLAVVNEYEEWRFAIFLLEGAAALAFMLMVVRFRGAPGGRLRLAVILVCASQILFESLRADEVLSWGFVKASQLLGAAGLFLVMVYGLFIRRRNAWRAPSHLALAAFFLIIFVIVGLEFAIDKTTININLIYLTMAACCLGLAALALRASAEGIHSATLRR